MSTTTNKNPIDARVALISNQLQLQHVSTFFSAEVQAAIEECAKKLQIIFKRDHVDTGRAIAALDLLQQTKHVAIDALKLPFVQ